MWQLSQKTHCTQINKIEENFMKGLFNFMYFLSLFKSFLNFRFFKSHIICIGVVFRKLAGASMKVPSSKILQRVFLLYLSKENFLSENSKVAVYLCKNLKYVL